MLGGICNGVAFLLYLISDQSTLFVSPRRDCNPHALKRWNVRSHSKRVNVVRLHETTVKKKFTVLIYIFLPMRKDGAEFPG